MHPVNHREAPLDRAAILAELCRAPLDLLVVGGGIVGAGIARDAALRGLRVGLVEQYDFACGTSSRSSRLLHGGLRYLAQGRVGLVREASIEKRIIHGIAPHLSAPLAFLFPTYRCPPWSTWALWKLRIGVKIYDLLCGGRNLGKSSAFDAARLIGYLPGIRRENLTGAVRYYDGLTNDARLVIDTLRSAANAGALTLNYCRVDQTRPEHGLWQGNITDACTHRQHTLTARTVVNATGPWAEQLDHSAVKLRLTKGVHLVIDHERLPVPDAVVMTEGSRILFAIPWGRRVILGTTDTDYEGRIEDVRTDPSDIAYVLEIVNRAFPNARLGFDDVISTWAGLRPLIANPNGKPSDISRAHEILSPAPGWWDVTGGKLTTYRLMAEQTVDRIEQFLHRPATACTTAQTPLLDAASTAGVSGIEPPEVSQRAVEHYCTREWAMHLEDVMLRRAGWHYADRRAEETARQVAQWMGETLGWDAARQSEEMHRYQHAAGVCAADPVGKPVSA